MIYDGEKMFYNIRPNTSDATVVALVILIFFAALVIYFGYDLIKIFLLRKRNNDVRDFLQYILDISYLYNVFHVMDCHNTGGEKKLIDLYKRHSYEDYLNSKRPLILSAWFNDDDNEIKLLTESGLLKYSRKEINDMKEKADAIIEDLKATVAKRDNIK